MYLVYLSGAPATGKSTLMARLTAGLERRPCLDVRLVPYDKLYRAGECVGAEIGRQRRSFPGTDALARHAMPAVVTWLGRGAGYQDILLGEGDRLSSIKALDAAADGGYEVHLVTLHARQSVLDERCAERGSRQNRSWRLGRATMTVRLGAYAEAAGYRVHALDAERPVDDLHRELLTQIPALLSLGNANDPVATRF